MTSDLINFCIGFLASVAANFFFLWLINKIIKPNLPYRWIGYAAGASLVIAAFLYILKEPWYWVAASAVVTFAFIVVVASLIRANRANVKSLEEKIHRLETELKTANEVLADAGVSRVWTREELPVGRCYDDIDGRYRWLGFSAVMEIANYSVKKQIIESSKAPRLEYIILDPRNELAIRHQAKVKNASAEQVKLQLHNTKESVRELREHPGQINVSLLKHSLFPTFRVTLVDNSKIFVGAYEPVPGKNKSSEYSGGFNSDLIELRESGGKNLLFKWFSLYYERERLHAEKQALERFAVSERFRAPYIPIDNLTQKAIDEGLTYMGKTVTDEVMQSILREFGIPKEGPTICQLHNRSGAICRLGVVKERTALEVKKVMTQAIRDGQDVEFLGVSGKGIIDDVREAILDTKNTKARGTIRILVLDPLSPSLARLVAKWRGIFDKVDQLSQYLKNCKHICQTMKEYPPTIELLSRSSAAFRIVHIVNVAMYVSSYVPDTPMHHLPHIELVPTGDALCLYEAFKRLIEWEKRKAAYEGVVRSVLRTKLAHPRMNKTSLLGLIKVIGCDVSAEQLDDILSEFEDSYVIQINK